MRSSPALTQTSGLQLVVVLLVAIGLGTSLPVSAQVPNPECLNCAVAVRTLEWNPEGEPGSFVGGVIRVENTGESSDAYDVAVTTTDTAWIAEAEVVETGTLAAGSGVLADTTANFRDIPLSVLVPLDARLGNETGITVTVTSQADAEVSASLSETVRSIQVFGWALDCTPTVSIMKTEKGVIALTATNTGNGADSAIVTTAPLNGLSIPDPQPITAAAGASVTEALDAGVGISLEDGEYTLRWDLDSTKSNATATCTTVLTVTGGTSAAPPAGDTNKDTPAPALVPVLLLVLVLARRTRRS